MTEDENGDNDDNIINWRMWMEVKVKDIEYY